MIRPLAAALLLATAALPALAQAPPGRIEIGVLTCDVEPGVGLVVGSKRQMRCVLQRAGGPPDRYLGAITKIGLDIGVTSKAVMSWAVLAATNLADGALAGGYGGLSAEATIGAGVGANALIGGSTRGIVLQPLSVQTQQGLNLAAGIAALELVPAGR